MSGVSLTTNSSSPSPFAGTVTTTDNTPTTLLSIPLGSTAGTYQVDAMVAAFNGSTPAGGGYEVIGSVRTNGTTATLIGTADQIFSLDTVLDDTDVALAVSGNNLIIQVTGVALIIDWAGSVQLVKVT